MDILLYPDDRLKQVSAEIKNIDEDVLQFIQQLENTRQAGPGAVGYSGTTGGGAEAHCYCRCIQYAQTLR